MQRLLLCITTILVGAAPAFAQRAINQRQALAGNVTPGDAAGFPVTITAPGHYKLTSNLVLSGVCGPHGIEVTSELVTIDLNGFAIIGTGCSDGIRSLAAAVHTTVTNGVVRNFATGLNLAVGADEFSEEGHRIERVKAFSNTGGGIAVGNFSMVVDCIAQGNGTIGITVGRGSLLLRNTSASNQKGLVAGPGSNLLQNTARANSIIGLEMADATVGYGQTVLVDNGTGGPQVTGGTALAPNLCGGLPCS